MIQVIEKLADIYLKHPAAFGPIAHHLVAERLERLVCRSSRSEAVRTVQEVLFVDRFQQHHDRPLEELVLQGGNSERAGLSSGAAFGNVHTSYRWRLVRAGLRAVEQALKVALQVLFVVFRSHSVYAKAMPKVEGEAMRRKIEGNRAGGQKSKRGSATKSTARNENNKLVAKVPPTYSVEADLSVAKPEKKSREPTARDVVAKAVGVSRRNIQKAKVVVEGGSKDLVAFVESGSILKLLVMGVDSSTSRKSSADCRTSISLSFKSPMDRRNLVQEP